MTDKKAKTWIAAQRSAYEAGELPKWKIRRIESIPGWQWGVDPGSLTARAKREDRVISRPLARRSQPQTRSKRSELLNPYTED